jgi:hypothetical protein
VLLASGGGDLLVTVPSADGVGGTADVVPATDDFVPGTADEVGDEEPAAVCGRLPSFLSWM